LAVAVNDALAERGLQPFSVGDFRSTPGEGAEATVEGRRVWIGRPEALSRRVGGDAVLRTVARAEALRRNGKTVSAFAIGDTVGVLAFQDTVRQGAADCIRRLRAQGVARLEMLTGDHHIVAEGVAAGLQLDGFHAELKPQDKLNAVERLRSEYGVIVLVGDGVNDAPALARADVGIAMGGMGADIAMEAADIVLMKERIESVAWLHDHAKRTAGLVRQNLTFAIAVIAILSVFAALGNIPLPLAVVGHEGSTVLVALNALRLLRTQDP
jgi:Cd2+/Zn2+-exporting ATPase